MALTKKQVKSYVKAGGVKCPYCNSEQIVCRSVDIDAGDAYQDISCLDCGKEWIDVYNLVGVISIPPFTTKRRNGS